jgi:hypothetical protein
MLAGVYLGRSGPDRSLSYPTPLTTVAIDKLRGPSGFAQARGVRRDQAAPPTRGPFNQPKFPAADITRDTRDPTFPATRHWRKQNCRRGVHPWRTDIIWRSSRAPARNNGPRGAHGTHGAVAFSQCAFELPRTCHITATDGSHRRSRFRRPHRHAIQPRRESSAARSHRCPACAFALSCNWRRIGSNTIVTLTTPNGRIEVTLGKSLRITDLSEQERVKMRVRHACCASCIRKSLSNNHCYRNDFSSRRSNTNNNFNKVFFF